MLFLIFLILAIIIFNLLFKETRWDWNKINLDSITFPKSFIWGTATASHQVEGNCKNNWSEFEKGFKNNGKPNIKDAQISGLACDHWQRYKSDIELIKSLGVKHYRFSLEWSKIEPELGVFNDEALNHYSDVIDELLKNNIEPVITLHHFSHPIWFDKLGAFEKEKIFLI